MKSCKVSFMFECDKLRQIESFAVANSLTVSEAFRFAIECGVETLKKAGYEMEQPPTTRRQPTRGIFPAPNRSE